MGRNLEISFLICAVWEDNRRRFLSSKAKKSERLDIFVS